MELNLKIPSKCCSLLTYIELFLQNVWKENGRTDASGILAQIFSAISPFYNKLKLPKFSILNNHTNWEVKWKKKNPESDILVNKVFLYFSWNNFSFFFWFMLVITYVHNVSRISRENSLCTSVDHCTPSLRRITCHHVQTMMFTAAEGKSLHCC